MKSWQTGSRQLFLWLGIVWSLSRAPTSLQDGLFLMVNTFKRVVPFFCRMPEWAASLREKQKWFFSMDLQRNNPNFGLSGSAVLRASTCMCLGYLLTVNIVTQKVVVSLRECIHSTTASTKFTVHLYCRDQVMPKSESVYLRANKAETTTSCLWNQNKCGMSCGLVVEPKIANKCDANP